MRPLGAPQTMPLHIPRYPLLTWKRWHGPGRGDTGCVLDAPHAIFTTSGRMAMALAFQSMGIQAGDELLLPAYHCPTMVHPVRWAGATPRFYRLHADLTPDLVDLQQKIGPRTRAVLAAHFFGFPVDLGALRTLCDNFRLVLVEDCAHSLFGGSRQHPIGSVGDYAVASLMKFFPVTDGGCLTAWRHRLDGLAMQSGGIGFEARACLNAIERAVDHGRLTGVSMPLRALFLAKDRMLAPRKRPQAGQACGGTAAGTPDPQPQDFDPARLHTRMTLFSRMVLACSDQGRNIARRRAAYTRMLDAFAHLHHCHPVRPALQDGVAPYVFPLWLDQPGRAWPAIQQAGLPAMRWDQLSTFAGDAACAASTACAQHLVQIPCHQGLTGQELDDLIAGIGQCITR